MSHAQQLFSLTYMYIAFPLLRPCRLIGIVFVTFGSFPLVQNIQKKEKKNQEQKQKKFLPCQFRKPPNSNTDKPPLKMSTIITQQCINRLTAEVGEESDAGGVNDFTTCIFPPAAALPNLPPPCSLFPPYTTFEHWHTHTVHHHWVCAGTMLEVKPSSVCPERSSTVTVTLLPGPKAHHDNTTEHFCKDRTSELTVSLSQSSVVANFLLNSPCKWYQ